MTADEVLQAMTALVNQNIALSRKVADLQAQLDEAKQPKEPVIGQAEAG